MGHNLTENLIGCHLVEKDSNGDLLFVWSYPNLQNDERIIFMRKCQYFFDCKNLQVSRFFRNKDQWVYTHFTEVFSSDKLSEVKHVGLIITAHDFNPERYETLCRVLAKSYCKSGQIPLMLQLFLSVAIKGKCTTEENGTYYLSEYETLNPYRNHRLKEIISRFGFDSVLIYNALLLKKKIVIYHYDVDSLIEFVLSLPAFLTHNNMWNSIYPWVHCKEDELPFFRESKFHIIGTACKNMENQLGIYDVFVNVPASEIVILPKAKESMTMTKMHKDIAFYMVQLAEKENLTERDVMQEISKKTKEFIDHLRENVAKEGPNQNHEEISKELSDALVQTLAQAENLS